MISRKILHQISTKSETFMLCKMQFATDFPWIWFCGAPNRIIKPPTNAHAIHVHSINSLDDSGIERHNHHQNKMLMFASFLFWFVCLIKYIGDCIRNWMHLIAVGFDVLKMLIGKVTVLWLWLIHNTYSV